MPHPHHRIVERFFAALETGALADDLFTPDMVQRSITAPEWKPCETYRQGIRILQGLFPGGLRYTIDAITAQEDRAAAEVRSHGVLVNGDEYANTYVFLFRIRDGRIDSISEMFDPGPVVEKLQGLILEIMARRA